MEALFSPSILGVSLPPPIFGNNIHINQQDLFSNQWQEPNGTHGGNDSRDSVTINLPRTESTWTGWCFATLPGASQKRRHESEKSTLYTNSYGMMVYESESYNMKLNKDICTYIAFNKNNKVTFRDGTPLKSVDTTTYLGTEIAKRAEPGLEISHRISLTMPVLKKLDLFWKQANVPKKWKLQVF